MTVDTVAVPRKTSATDAHYEALRKAYDDRVKSLSKKLRGHSIESSPVTVAESADHDGQTVYPASGSKTLMGSSNSSFRDLSTRDGKLCLDAHPGRSVCGEKSCLVALVFARGHLQCSVISGGRRSSETILKFLSKMEDHEHDDESRGAITTAPTCTTLVRVFPTFSSIFLPALLLLSVCNN